MKQCTYIFALIVLCVVLQGCGSSQDKQSQEELQRWMAPNGKIKILSTIAMINDIVKQIGADQVDAIALIYGELDPHSYQLVKGDDEKLSHADIIFFNGVGLEHGPSLQSYLAESPKAVSVGDKIRNEDPSIVLLYNGSTDPHLWMDVSIWSKIIPFIVDALSERDPGHASLYKERGEQVSTTLLKKHQELKMKMGKVPAERRYLVTSHDAFNYFARAYLAADEEVKNNKWQKRFVAPEGLAPDSQLNPAEILMILEHMQQYGVHVVFPELTVSQASIRKLVNAGQQKGMKLCIVPEALYSDSLGRPGSDADTYLTMIEHNAKIMIKYLTQDSCDE